MAQCVKPLTPGFGSGSDLGVVRWGPMLGPHSVQSLFKFLPPSGPQLKLIKSFFFKAGKNGSKCKNIMLERISEFTKNKAINTLEKVTVR